MGNRDTTQTTYTPWGSDEQRSLLDSTTSQYDTINESFPQMWGNVQDTYSQVDPNSAIQSQQALGLQTLNEAYEPQYRKAQQLSAARFGGSNTTQARDIESELNNNFSTASSKLGSELGSNLYGMQQNQFQNALQMLGVPITYGNQL